MNINKKECRKYANPGLIFKKNDGLFLVKNIKYINQKAQEYIKQEMEMNGEKPIGGGYGEDIPDDLCYQWAEDYFRDTDAEIDKDKDDKFVPKTYYGGLTSKSKKKETVKKNELTKTTSADSAPADQMQLSFEGA